MSEKLYGYITNSPEKNKFESEAVDDGLLFDLLMGGAGILKGVQKGVTALKNINRLSDLKELNDKRKDWGIAYRKYSGDEEGAINKLMETQNGFVPNATNKFGGIDFVWGNNNINKKGKNVGYGLKHIQERRNEQGYDGEQFLRELPDLLNNSVKYTKPEHLNRFYFGDGIKEGAVRTDFNGKPRQWLDSSYYLD